VSYTTDSWLGRMVRSSQHGPTLAAWRKWLQSLPSFEPVDSMLQTGLEDVRQRVLAVLDDCVGTDCERLRWRLRSAPSARELWMLRGAVFQQVANQHCQATAAERINSLAPLFREYLPARLVSRV
jgi:hypothetical protein